jgi:hypothetical protein
MIWDFQDMLSRRLLLWSALSIAAGVLLVSFGESPFWRGFGLQALIWGGIDAAIALFGQRSSRKRRAEGPHGPEALGSEARKLRRLLWINTGLDVLYVAGGVVLPRRRAPQRFAAGSGWGIIVQGGFLFVFDLLHAIATPMRQPTLPAIEFFSGAEHAAFRLDGGAPAALLLHGFLGTPAEMRGLAGALNRQGWTAEVPLLPGFGSDVATLTERRCMEWLDAVEAAARGLTATGHRPCCWWAIRWARRWRWSQPDHPPGRPGRSGALLVDREMVDASHRVLRAAVPARRLSPLAQGGLRQPATAPGARQVLAGP